MGDRYCSQKELKGNPKKKLSMFVLRHGLSILIKVRIVVSVEFEGTHANHVGLKDDRAYKAFSFEYIQYHTVYIGF